MADYELIDSYLEALRSQGQRADIDQVVAELEDHFYTSVECLLVGGAEPTQAQRETLERFGDPEVMANSFASRVRGGPMVPTQATQRAGKLSIAGGILWLATIVFWWIAGLLPPVGEVAYESFNGFTDLFYPAGAASLLGAGALTVMTMVALNRRHGGLGRLANAGLILTGLGFLASMAAWVFVVWASLMMLGTLSFGLSMLQKGTAPRIPALAIAGAFVVGASTILVGTLMSGEVNQSSLTLWEANWRTNLTGLTIGAVILGIGLLQTGVWLRSETPIDADSGDPALLAP